MKRLECVKVSVAQSTPHFRFGLLSQELKRTPPLVLREGYIFLDLDFFRARRTLKLCSALILLGMAQRNQTRAFNLGFIELHCSLLFLHHPYHFSDGILAQMLPPIVSG